MISDIRTILHYQDIGQNEKRSLMWVKFSRWSDFYEKIDSNYSDCQKDFKNVCRLLHIKCWEMGQTRGRRLVPIYSL